MKEHFPENFDFLLFPARYSDEPFEKYKVRQRRVNSHIRKYRQGVLENQQLWISRDLVSGRTATYVRKKHGAL